jgi:ribosomal protein L11 methyltransferase
MWLQTHLKVKQSEVDLVSEILTALGSISLTFCDTFDKPIFEPPVGDTPVWADTTITALFEKTADTIHITKTLKEFCNIQTLKFEPLADKTDKKWVIESIAGFEPLQFGENIWIVPSWHSDTKLPQDAIILDLDPGLAFGTGTHQTTSLCLEYLDKNPPKNLTVIDYGCGSGILAIAAAKLGAKKVYAIDNDPQAVQATKDNALKNKVDIEVYLNSDEPKMTCDLLLANILAKPLQTLAPHFTTMIKDKGVIVLAGLLNEQTNEVINAYQDFDFKTRQKDDWTRLLGMKK